MVENAPAGISVLLQHRRKLIGLVGAAAVATAAFLAFGLPGPRSAATSAHPGHTHVRTVDAVPVGSVLTLAPAVATTISAPPVTTTTAATATPAPRTTALTATTPPQVPEPTAVAVAPVAPTISALVANVEAAGIEPGANWSWSIGDTATHCGVITGTGTGCTFGAAGLEQTVFAGSPTLALVAHELANAETQNDAVPSLLNEVAAAAGATSWSPTDAVASCLVANFMGFQDQSAGTWQCPAPLASFVADNIHDTLSAIVVAPS